MKILALFMVFTSLAFLTGRSWEYWICGKCGASGMMKDEQL